MFQPTVKAFLFDLNGTMIDDMEYHIIAWHDILNELGADISYEKAKAECYGKNHELLERIFPGRFTDEEKTAMSYAKEEKYQREFRPRLKLIDGLDKLIKDAKEHQIAMAIGSAAIKFNIDFVLDGLFIRDYFSAIVCADDVNFSKPHPETYLKCATALGASPGSCIVFEDTPKGVECAYRAGMKAVVVNTMHEAAEFSAFDNILFFAKDFTGISFEKVLSSLGS
jgi:HAD superfamily hydrolase (TIGR01509 family)